jgi:hypothetical protein
MGCVSRFPEGVAAFFRAIDLRGLLAFLGRTGNIVLAPRLTAVAGAGIAAW